MPKVMKKESLSSFSAGPSTVDDDRRFAQMAIDEAKKSVPEDGRLHPKVGAVVVKDGRVVGRAHRGENPKSHAEYIALEDKLSDDLVAGATVYTTLEPCTTRTHPKIPCAKRLIERKVARVVIGMLDPNPEIRGLGDQMMGEANIETQLFPRDLRAQVEEMNREFIREQKQKQERNKPHMEDRKESVKFLTARKVNLRSGIASMTFFEESVNTGLRGVVACFRNEGAYGEPVKQFYGVRAHLRFKNTKGDEIGTGVSGACWMGTKFDSIDLKTDESACVLLLLSPPNGRMFVPWKRNKPHDIGSYVIDDHPDDCELKEYPGIVEIRLVDTNKELVLPPIEIDMQTFKPLAQQ